MNRLICFLAGALVAMAENRSELVLGHQLAMAAYEQPGSLSEWKCGAACENTQNTRLLELIVDDSKQLFGFMAANSDVLILSFRGTKMYQAQNWAVNADFAKVAFGGGFVHRGFLSAYQEIRSKNSFIQMLNSSALGSHSGIRLVDRFSKILVVGHSLGGSLASFAALDLVQTFGKRGVVVLLTYGQPRLGDAAFADFMTEAIGVGSYKRVVNGRDLVPHLPPMALGFKHAGSELWIRSPGQMQLCEYQPFESLNCSNSLELFNIKDHLSYFESNYPLAHVIAGPHAAFIFKLLDYLIRSLQSLH